MKKLVFLATMFVAISFASCGNTTETVKAVTDSDSIAVVDSVVDSTVVDSIVVDSASAE